MLAKIKRSFVRFLNQNPEAWEVMKKIHDKYPQYRVFDRIALNWADETGLLSIRPYYKLEPVAAFKKAVEFELEVLFAEEWSSSQWNKDKELTIEEWENQPVPCG